jgi:hypothetical protein
MIELLQPHSARSQFNTTCIDGNTFSSVNEIISQLPGSLFNFPTYVPHSDRSMLFTSSGFLALDSLMKLPPEDATFLEIKGCLRLPTRASLDEVVRHFTYPPFFARAERG